MELERGREQVVNKAMGLELGQEQEQVVSTAMELELGREQVVSKAMGMELGQEPGRAGSHMEVEELV